MIIKLILMSNINQNVFQSVKQSDNKNSNFESFVPEFKEGRENVINILKILLEQKKYNHLCNL